ncbi:MAG: DUF6789 family protein [Candidatus Bathyarchaeia archaeon]
MNRTGTFYWRVTLIPSEISTGLVAGLGATAVMTLSEYPIWRRWGMEGVSEWHLNQVIMGRMMNRSPPSVVAPGLLLHFVHGGLAGIIFTLLLPEISSIPTIEAAIGFGIVLWIIALIIMKPVTGIELRRHPLSILPLIVSLGGHILFGLILGLAVVYI